MILILNICLFQVIDSKPPVETPFEKLVAELKVKNIHLFHIDHKARCLPPKMLNSHCFQFLLGITAIPRENRRRRIGKILGVNRVHCGLCENSEF